MTHRTHLAYLVELARPLHHEDDDLNSGRYHDANGDAIGEAIFGRYDQSGRFLLIVDDAMSAVHVEAVLDADHRVEDFERRAVMRYGEPSEAPAGIREDGDAWISGEYVAYVFGSEEEARTSEKRVASAG